jgi:hypothetical protein
MKTISLWLTLGLAAVPPLSALEITLTLNTEAEDRLIHANDPNHQHLTRIVRAAADYWESIILDDHTLAIEYYYSEAPRTLSQGTIALANNRETKNISGRINIGLIRFVPYARVQTDLNGDGDSNDPGERFVDPETPFPWFFDLTPSDHSEYDFLSEIYFDLPFNERIQTFSLDRDVDGGIVNHPPFQLEIDYEGMPSATAPADLSDQFDLFSFALHEIGHLLGFNSTLPAVVSETADLDYDANPTLLGGYQLQVKTRSSTNIAHLACQNCVMFTGISRGFRRLPSATEILALGVAPDPDWSQINFHRQDFLPNGTNSWKTPSNWLGNRIPDSTKDVYIRGAESDAVGVLLNSDTRVENLFIGEDSTLLVDGSDLTIDQTLSSSWNGSFVGPGCLTLRNGAQVTTRNLQLSDQFLNLEGNSTLEIFRTARLDFDSGRLPEIFGHGTISLPAIIPGTINATPSLVNNGRLKGGFQSTLVFRCDADEVWDLDGDATPPTGGLEAMVGNIHFISGSLAGPFRGSMAVRANHFLKSERDWTFGEAGQGNISLQGDPLNINNGNPATLGGNGRIHLVGGEVTTEGMADITTSTLWSRDITLTCEENSRLTLRDDIGLEGGSFEGEGSLHFDAPLVVSQPVTLSTKHLRFPPNDDVLIASTLVVESEFLDEISSNTSTTFNIGNPVVPGSTLTVNSPNPWTVLGELNFGGLPPTHLRGSSEMTLALGATSPYPMPSLLSLP